MYRVIVYGNCQRSGLHRALRHTLPAKYKIESYFNTPRAGVCVDDAQLEARFSQADVIVYQPLPDAYHFNERRMDQFPAKKIRFPYIFNHGIAGLCYAPGGTKNAYGQIFGEDAVIPYFEDGTIEDAMAAYVSGGIRFNVRERFELCQDELRHREESMEVRVASFIAENHTVVPLYIAHNHPTFPVFKEMAAQVCALLGEAPREYDDWLNSDAYNCPGISISPYDAQELGYAFGFHTDWVAKARRMLEIIYQGHILGEKDFDKAKTDPMPFPDSMAEESGMMRTARTLSRLMAPQVPAEEFIKETLINEIQYYDYFYGIGLYYFKKSQFQQAEPYLLKAIALDPLKSGAFFCLSQIASKYKNWVLALRYASMALKNDRSPRFYQVVGYLLLLLGKDSAAERRLKQGLALNPNMGLSHHCLAQIYERNRRMEEARDCIRTALKIEPANPAYQALSTKLKA